MVNIQAYIGDNDKGIKTLFVKAQFDKKWVHGLTITGLAISTEDYYSESCLDVTNPLVWYKEYEQHVEKVKTLEYIEDVIIDPDLTGGIVNDYIIHKTFSEDTEDTEILELVEVGEYIRWGNGIYRVTEESLNNEILSIQEEINLNEILSLTKGDNHLYIVQVRVDSSKAVGTDAFSRLECIDLKSCYTALVYDFSNEIQTALCVAETIDTCCNIPCELMDRILKLQALRLAIDTNNIALAVKFFKKLANESIVSSVKKGCNCHG